MIQSLRHLSDDLNVPFQELQAYTQEDDIGGWQSDNKGKWHIGSMMPSEGKLLYAIVRALKPKVMLEFGTFRGCSTSHILSALVKNGIGVLHSYDLYDVIERDRFTSAMIDRWQFHLGNILTNKNLPQADIVFEDTIHSTRITREMVRKALSVNPKMIICHDGAHHVVGAAVRQGFLEATGCHGTVIRPDNDHCGFVYKLL